MTDPKDKSMDTSLLSHIMQKTRGHKQKETYGFKASYRRENKSKDSYQTMIARKIQKQHRKR